MKRILKIAILSPVAVLMFLIDAPPQLPPPYLQLAPEAHAILGVRRRAFRRGVIIGGSAAAVGAAAASQQQAAAAQQQAAAAQKQAAAPQEQAAAAPRPAAPAPPPVSSAPPPPAAAGKQLPLGTVVSTLPAGCTSTPVGGLDYFYCGGNFYRAAFQGSNLVYVTAQP